jgi:hypothetical protein
MDLSGSKLTAGTVSCDGLGFMLVTVLWTVHLWTLMLAFGTFMILIHVSFIMSLSGLELIFSPYIKSLVCLKSIGFGCGHSVSAQDSATRKTLMPVWIIAIVVAIIGNEVYGYTPGQFARRFRYRFFC